MEEEYRGIKITLNSQKEFRVGFKRADADDGDGPGDDKTFATWEAATTAIDNRQKKKAAVAKETLDLPVLVAGKPDRIKGVHLGTSSLLYVDTTISRYDHPSVYPDTEWTRRATAFMKRLNIVRDAVQSALEDVAIGTTRKEAGNYNARVSDVSSVYADLKEEHAAHMKDAKSMAVALPATLNIFAEEGGGDVRDWTDFDASGRAGSTDERRRGAGIS